MRIISFILVSILLYSEILLAEVASKYEWWVDSDISLVKSGIITGDKIEFQADVSDLSVGLHTLRCRLHTETGTYGSVYQKLFFIPPKLNKSEAVAFEYWIDNGLEAKVTGSVLESENNYTIDLSNIPSGDHTFYYRLRNETGLWGPLYIAGFTNSTKCGNVEVTYNGRFITLSTVDSNSEIRYTLNGNDPAKGEKYNDQFDAKGLATLKAVAIKPEYTNSDTSELEIKYYADEEHAETSEGGLLKECFGWTNNDWIESIEEFALEGELNKADYATLQSFKSLRHLDLTKVHSDTVPEGVFTGLPLVSVSMPRSIGEYGDLLFNQNKNLCAIIWNSEDLAVDSRLLNGVDNPNLLVYFPNQTSVSDAFTSGANKIVADHTDIIKLKDGYPFFAPRTFNTDEISYTRNFSKETVIGTSSGWESLTVPFDVEEIKDAKGIIKPFEISKDESDRPFWLYSPEASGWLAAAGINAYEPYIIAMPFSSDYVDQYNIHGDVTFIARQAIIMASGEAEPFSYKNGSQMWSNFSYLPVGDNLWVINDDWNEGNAPGSTFVRGLRDVRPFECFLTSVNQRRMPIFDSSDINGILLESDLKVWSENNAICITSGKNRTVNIFDTVGQLVRIVEIPGGETVRVKDLAPGIYLAGRFKVMLR